MTYHTSHGLGREGVHSLGLWKEDLNRVLKSHTGQYVMISAVDLVRRATVWCTEPTPNKASQLGAVHEEVPVSVSSSSVRDCVATILPNAVSPSAASTVILFDFEGGLSPQAESTPPDNLKRTNHPAARRSVPHNPHPTPRCIYQIRLKRRTHEHDNVSSVFPPGNKTTRTQEVHSAAQAVLVQARYLWQGSASTISSAGP